MQDPTTVNSIHFLWIAYAVVILANVGTVGFFLSKWSRLNKPER